MKMMEHNSDQLKYTCTECDYKITNHASIDKHVGSIHGIKEVDIVYMYIVDMCLIKGLTIIFTSKNTHP